MKIFVTAKPDAYENRIEKIDDTHFVVSVTEPPIAGRANRAILKALGEYFHTSPSAIRIVSGFSSRQKVIVFP